MSTKYCKLCAIMTIVSLSLSCTNGLKKTIDDEVAHETATGILSIQFRATGNGTKYNEAAIDPAFSPDRLSYTMDLGAATAFKLTAIVPEDGITITSSYNGGAGFAIQPGSESGAITVSNGESSLIIKTTSANGQESRTYTVGIVGGFLQGLRPELHADDRSNDDSFGDGVAVSGNGDTVVVGADIVQSAEYASIGGHVYVYSRGASSWSRTAILADSPSTGWDLFGQGVCISRDATTLVCGAKSYSGVGVPGTLHVYSSTGSGWTLKASQDGQQNDEYFGTKNAMAADGSIIAIGAPMHTVGGVNCQGMIYLYAWSGSSLTAMPGGTLVGPDAVSYGVFGFGLALSSNGTILAAGAPGANAAYVYRYTSTWGSGLKLAPAGLAAGDRFGSSIALSADGTNLAIGAPGSGKVYLYLWNTSMASWDQVQVLSPGDASPPSQFGYALAISDDGLSLVVGAPDLSGNPGAIYRFRKTGVSYAQVAKTCPPDSTNNDHFGYSVGLSGNGSTVVVGAYTKNAAYIY